MHYEFNLVSQIIPLSRYDRNDRTGRLATSGEIGHPDGQIDEKANPAVR